MADRSADEIQRDIEQARVTLATSVDELTYRTNPKRVSEGIKATLIAKAKTPQGQAVLGGAGVLVLVVVVRRFRHR
jgi:hypothetical protein